MRLARLFVCFCLILLLAACGTNNTSFKSNSSSPGSSNTTADSNNTSNTPNNGGSPSGSQTTGNYVYVVTGSSLAGFVAKVDGSFTPVATLKSSNQLRSDSLTASPDGRFLYSFENTCGTKCSGRYDNRLLVQAIASDGSLSDPVQVVGPEEQPTQVMLSRSMKWAFVLSGPDTDRVTIYPLNPDGTFGSATGRGQLPPAGTSLIFGGQPYSKMIGFTVSDVPTLWVKVIEAYRDGDEPSLQAVQYDENNGAVLNVVSNNLMGATEVEGAAVVDNKLVASEAGTWTWIAPNTMTTFSHNLGVVSQLKRCDGCGSNDLIAHPLLPVVYAIRGGLSIYTYDLSSDGSLTPVGNGYGYIYGVNINPEGTRMFAITSGPKLTSLSIDQTTGDMTPMESIALAAKAGAIASVKK